MPVPAQFPWRFIDVAAVRMDRAFIAAQHADDGDDAGPVGAVLSWNGTWSRKAFTIGVVSVCLQTAPAVALLMLGYDGSIVRWGAKDFSEECLDPAGDGPRLRGGMREVRAIGAHAYAVGMGRMVYRCDGDNDWVRVDDGARVAAHVTDVGFNSVDGTGPDDLYAVGWNGEIWHFDGRVWAQEDSPTALALHRVVCMADGRVYAVGQQGVLLSRQSGRWTLVAQDATRQDVWGACEFGGQLYLCTGQALYVLEGGGLRALALPPAVQGAGGFHRLSASASAIWLVGDRVALHSADGVTWSEVSYP